MSAFAVVTNQELVDFAAVLHGHGMRQEDFELQEAVFDPQQAEVEGARGELSVHCLPSQAVSVYRLGAGTRWVDEFAGDLQRGRYASASAS